MILCLEKSGLHTREISPPDFYSSAFHKVDCLTKLWIRAPNLKCLKTTGDIFSRRCTLHWNKLHTNCLGLLTAPGVVLTGMAFSGAFSGSVLLWNKSYLSVNVQTHIMSVWVQLCILPQLNNCHFCKIVNKCLGYLRVSFIKKLVLAVLVVFC